MKITIMTVYDYVKLNHNEKELLLKNDALFLEHYTDNKDTIYVYFLYDFFVEVRLRDGMVTDSLPYKRGYRINKNEFHTLEKRNTFYT